MRITDNIVDLDVKIYYGYSIMPSLVLVGKAGLTNRNVNFVINHTSTGCFVTFSSIERNEKCIHYFTLNDSAQLDMITEKDIHTLKHITLPQVTSFFVYNYMVNTCFVKFFGY